MQWLSKSWRALLVSFEVLLVLVFGLVLFLIQVDFERANTKPIVISFASVSILLIVKMVFDAKQRTEVAKDMAEDLAADIIRSSRELFTELYRSSPVPYVLIAEDGGILSTNLSALRLLHIGEGEFDGQNVFELLRSEKGDEHISLFSEKLRQGLPVDDEEVEIKRKDGTYRWVLLSLFSYVDLTDNKRRGLLTLVDITKQKQIDKAKTEFVSLASHQLRTPISALRWNTELLAKKVGTTLGEEVTKYIDKIANNVTRMDLLVGDFLNVSKFELGTLKPEFKSVSLEPFVLTILDEQHEKIEKKGLSVEHVLDDSIPTITSDPNILHMVVSNLVSNAVKYTPEGGQVRIATEGKAGNLVISVTDTGMGIPYDDQEHIFSKIFRAGNAKSQVPEGTGLGLYIVKEAVEVLGGTIEFVSEENKGSTFTVVLPR